MMEDHEFCDSCEGCKPAILNAQTKKPIPYDDPMMIAVMDVWNNNTSFAQRRSYIEVTLKNSRREHDMKLFTEVMEMIKAKLDKA